MSKIYSFSCFLIFFLSGCSKEIAIPILADFEVVTDQNDFTIPAKVSLNNKTVGAENYLWTFEGGDPSTSDKRNPGVIVYRNAGTYSIKLQADNFDGIKQIIEKQIVINSKINVDFSYIIEGDSFSPVIVSFKNSSSGSDKFEWIFEGGAPSTSTQGNPKVIFENGGKHKVSLKVFNQQVSLTKDSTVTFQPELSPNFDIEIPKQYEELEAPAEIFLKNNSIGNTTNNWFATGADNPISIEKEPTMRFSKAGTFNIRLETGNGKKTKSVTKEIIIKPNKGYSYIKDIKLGIYSPQNSSAVYYSTFLRKSFAETVSLSKSEVESIDLVYFGLNQNFVFNQFISPNEAQNVGIKTISGASKTILINSQSDISPSAFDKIDAAFLNSIQMDKINEIDNYFTDKLPTLILFENSHKKKGVVLVKSFIRNGINSQIVFDIKVLK